MTESDKLVLKVFLNHMYGLSIPDRQEILREITDHLIEGIPFERGGLGGDPEGVFMYREENGGIKIMSNTHGLIGCRDSSNGYKVYLLSREDYGEFLEDYNTIRDYTSVNESIAVRKWIKDKLT